MEPFECIFWIIAGIAIVAFHTIKRMITGAFGFVTIAMVLATLLGYEYFISDMNQYGIYTLYAICGVWVAYTIAAMSQVNFSEIFK